MTTNLHAAESHTILPVERLGDTLLVVPHGDLGGYSPHSFQSEYQRVQKLLDDPTLKNLIIDLGNSRYFGSEMIGALVAMREKVISRGRVALTNVSSDTRAGLDIIKADSLFEFFETRSEAIARIATLTIGDRVHRHRRPLRWIGGLLVLFLVVWGAYASQVVYQVFGSQSALRYELLARRWDQYETGSTQWTADEARTYKSQLLDELASLDQRMQQRYLFPVPEDRWLRKAISDFEDYLHSDEDYSAQKFLVNMRAARYYIVRRTGLKLPTVGLEDGVVGDIPPEAPTTAPASQSPEDAASDDPQETNLRLDDRPLPVRDDLDEAA